jgi:hypothetical protein
MSDARQEVRGVPEAGGTPLAGRAFVITGRRRVSDGAPPGRSLGPALESDSPPAGSSGSRGSRKR